MLQRTVMEKSLIRDVMWYGSKCNIAVKSDDLFNHKLQRTILLLFLRTCKDSFMRGSVC